MTLPAARTRSTDGPSAGTRHRPPAPGPLRCRWPRRPAGTSAPPPPPGPGDRTRRPPPAAGLAEGRATLSRLLLCLGTAAALTSHHLRSAAEHQPLGPTRTVLLSTATALDQQAHTWWLDRPDLALAHLLGRSPNARSPDALAPDALSPAAPRTVAPDVYGPPRPDTPAPTGPDPAAYGPPRPGEPWPTAQPATPAEALAVQPPTGATAAVASGRPLRRPEPDHARLQEAGPPAGGSLEHGRAVDQEHRLRVWAGGDSLGQYVGNRLLSPLSDRELSDVELDYHISTGLARPDFFDWPAHLRAVMSRPAPPEALVLMIGGNDNQPMLGPGGATLATGSDPWFAEYRRRVAGVMDTAGAGGARLWWIGLPPMRDPARDALSRRMTAIVAEEAAGRPWVTTVDLLPLFVGPDGGYASVVNGPDGRRQVARAPDGVHVTAAGSAWVADRIWPALASTWGLSTPS